MTKLILTTLFLALTLTTAWSQEKDTGKATLTLMVQGEKTSIDLSNFSFNYRKIRADSTRQWEGAISVVIDRAANEQVKAFLKAVSSSATQKITAIVTQYKASGELLRTIRFKNAVVTNFSYSWSKHLTSDFMMSGTIYA